MPVVLDLFSAWKSLEEGRVDQGHGWKSWDSGQLSQQKCAYREERIVWVEAERVQVQELKKDPFPEVDSSKFEEDDDG